MRYVLGGTDGMEISCGLHVIMVIHICYLWVASFTLCVVHPVTDENLQWKYFMLFICCRPSPNKTSVSTAGIRKKIWPSSLWNPQAHVIIAMQPTRPLQLERTDGQIDGQKSQTGGWTDRRTDVGHSINPLASGPRGKKLRSGISRASKSVTAVQRLRIGRLISMIRIGNPQLELCCIVHTMHSMRHLSATYIDQKGNIPLDCIYTDSKMVMNMMHQAINTLRPRRLKFH